MGNIYAGADGNVYRRTDSRWSQWNNGSWNAVQPRAQSRNTQAASTADLGQLNQDYQARMHGADRPSPDQPVDSTTGLGDINLFDVFLFKAGALELGVGPPLTIPSATNDLLGRRKWQAGTAATMIAPQPWGLLGGLVTYQHSFAGDEDRPPQNGLQAQPFVIYNLPQGFYLRSTATWNFDLQRGNYYLPLGLGVGKVWKTVDGVTLNLFVEPQGTVAHEGVAPKLQVFMGLNMQFPLGH